jgi:hypothetical protein
MTYGPPTAREHLRSSVMTSIEWQSRHQPLDRMPSGVETAHEIKPTPVWRIVAAFVLAALLVVIAISVARASEPPRTWQVWNETTNRPWLSKKGEPATATGPTACNLSLWEVAKAAQDGTRLSCRRIDEARR